MKKQILLFALMLGLLFSCKKDKPETFPDVNMTITEKTLVMKLQTEKTFSVNVAEGKSLTNIWKLDGKVVSEGISYTFKPLTAGNYTLVYTGNNHLGSFTYTYEIEVPVPVKDSDANSSKYISKIFEYLPAPGQFVNEASYGTVANAQRLIGATGAVISLGGFGGYIIFGFDHSIKNQDGYDLGIYGNPYAGPNHFSEPGIVMVSQDKNGNGLPDDEWYELAGSEYDKATTIKNYEITYYNPKGFANVPWTDNQGKSGFVLVNNFHKHNFYPEFADNQEKITFKGTLLPSTIGKNGGITINTPFEWGYTDSYSVGDDYNSKRYNSFDISWAVDKNGKKVNLKTIDFIKVYTGQNADGGSVGEISTEILGAIDLNIK